MPITSPMNKALPVAVIASSHAINKSIEGRLIGTLLANVSGGTGPRRRDCAWRLQGRAARK